LAFSEATEIKEYTDIDEKFSELRTKVFNETVYLGYELSQQLIRLNSMMKEGLRLKRTEHAYSGSKYQL
jgi:predicted nuclease with TOPRIM domain